MSKLIVLLVFLLVPLISAADELVVHNTSNYDQKSLQLDKGELGAIKAFVRTNGDELRGVKVILTELGKDKPVQSQLANELGEVWFFSVSAAAYKVEVESQASEGSFGVIEIGDFQLLPMSSVPTR